MSPGRCGTKIFSAVLFSAGESQENRTVAPNAPVNCISMNPGASFGRMPANVSVRHRARVTAGFANDVEAVNQYAAVMYAPTANGTDAIRAREHPQMTESKPNAAMNSLNNCAEPVRT